MKRITKFTAGTDFRSKTVKRRPAYRVFLAETLYAETPHLEGVALYGDVQLVFSTGEIREQRVFFGFVEHGATQEQMHNRTLHAWQNAWNRKVYEKSAQIPPEVVTPQLLFKDSLERAMKDVYSIGTVCG